MIQDTISMSWDKERKRNKKMNKNTKKLNEIKEQDLLQYIHTDAKDLLSFLNFDGDEDEFVSDETISISINLIENHLMQNLKTILDVLKGKE